MTETSSPAPSKKSAEKTDKRKTTKKKTVAERAPKAAAKAKASKKVAAEKPPLDAKPHGEKSASQKAKTPKAKASDGSSENGAASQKQASTASKGSQKAKSVSSGEDVRSLIDDFDALSEYLVDVSGRSQNVIQEFFGKNADFMRIAGGAKSADPLNVGESYQEMMNGFATDPGVVMQRQFNLWGDYAKLMATMSRRLAGEDVRPAVTPDAADKRFQHPAWEDNHLLDFIKQSYLTYSNWLKTTVEEIDFDDDHERKRAEFYTQQFIDAIAPTNFPMLNPEVVETTINSRGENLMKGLKNLLEDIDRGHGELSIRQADLEFFKLGENIATTPGAVVFENDIMQLIQYEPATKDVAERPLLIFPPWINKFYILDLQAKNSFIRWMVEQGRTVFVVSWVNPSPDDAPKTFEDYVKEGCFAALDAIEKATGAEAVDAIGYCIGGTMLSAALSLMAARGDNRIQSATFFTAQADFEEAGDLLLFVDDAQLNSIEKQMDAAGGVLEGRAMASTFNMLRSNDLIWQFVIDNYMKGKDPARFDLLFWNSDSTRMPKLVHLFYLREFYQKNALAKGEMVMDGVTLDPGLVNIPMFFQAGETDHIAPHNSVYRTARLFSRNGNDKIRYMLAGSGHIAGVVNHPDRKKYHHSVNAALPATLEEWKADAVKDPGSWWAYWMEWLNNVSPGAVPARRPGDGDLPAIEPAPGRYVEVKS
ncbi:MAG: class I poly(R)-hydroxyalkanoic acid synthase [Pseudomonadota bacterium]